MKIRKLMRKYLTIHRRYRPLYDLATTEMEFEVLKRILDVYGSEVVNKLEIKPCHSRTQAYLEYVKQLLDMKTSMELDSFYDTIECLMIRETLLVENIPFDAGIYRGIACLCSGENAHYFEDVMYAISKDTSLLEYFGRELSTDNLFSIFNVAISQLTEEECEVFEKKYLWSYLNIQ